MTYDNLDHQILVAIGLGARDFTAISAHCAAERDRLALQLGIGPTVAFRLVDRRLQALRRRRAIEYRPGQGWRITEAA